MKILINTPDISKLGGVANHYKGLKPYWSQNVSYNFIGSRKGIPGPIILVFDYIKFFFLCIFCNYDVILLNPSLGKTAIKRDALFLRIAKWFKIKTVVFFHGWSSEVVSQLNTDSTSFAQSFNRADKIIVLAKAFKNDLLNWRIKKTIHISSTKVNDEFIKSFSIENKKESFDVLFLTRIETYKGIFTTLEAFKFVKSICPSAKLTIAGDGSQLGKAKEIVQSNKLKDVYFLGNISGELLAQTFFNSAIYILPSHGEGMPTSVLEAMAFGLPIISRPVGGLVDFFEDGKMGYLIESLEPQDYAKKIIQLIENPDEIKEIGRYNHAYVKKNFMASKVAREMEKILTDD